MPKLENYVLVITVMIVLRNIVRAALIIYIEPYKLIILVTLTLNRRLLTLLMLRSLISNSV